MEGQGSQRGLCKFVSLTLLLVPAPKTINWSECTSGTNPSLETHLNGFDVFTVCSAMSPTHQELIHTYRCLYKHLLRAVQYSKPARFIARNRLRLEYRNNPVSHYDSARISRTLEFLDTAAKTAGLEHRIVKNLMHVWWEQQAFQRRSM